MPARQRLARTEAGAIPSGRPRLPKHRPDPLESSKRDPHARGSAQRPESQSVTDPVAGVVLIVATVAAGLMAGIFGLAANTGRS